MIHNPSYILSKLYYLTFNPSYSQSVINSELAKLGLKKKNHKPNATASPHSTPTSNFETNLNPDSKPWFEVIE